MSLARPTSLLLDPLVHINLIIGPWNMSILVKTQLTMDPFVTKSQPNTHTHTRYQVQ